MAEDNDATVIDEHAAAEAAFGDLKPSWADLSRAMNRLLLERDHEWCGFPMPLPDSGLVIAPGHPKAAQIAEIQAIFDERRPTETPDDEWEKGWALINTWRTIYRGIPGQVQILRHEDGRREWQLVPDVTQRNKILFGCFTACEAWDLEAEYTAMDRLSTLVTEHAFKCYVMTGGFLETSARSGLTYWFRRLRPTVVLTPHRNLVTSEILCTLCLHPLAYYAETWCGAMVPTDDVIAHLVMMRGDEHRFWGRANHHPPGTPEAGL